MITRKTNEVYILHQLIPKSNTEGSQHAEKPTRQAGNNFAVFHQNIPKR